MEEIIRDISRRVKRRKIKATVEAEGKEFHLNKEEEDLNKLRAEQDKVCFLILVCFILYIQVLTWIFVGI